jgi:hypothetical protein
MTPIAFVLLVLAAFVLGCGALILRAFFRVRGEPMLVDSAVREFRPGAEPAQATALPGPLRPQAPAALPEPEPGRRERLAGTSLDKEALTTLKQWYVGRECAVCKREIGPVHGSEPRPGLLNVAATTPEIMTWDDIPPGHLKTMLDSHLPVCASCALAESFRRRFPDRVTDRPDPSARDRAYH